VDVAADHVDHAAKIAGINRVGIGSDFDGIAATKQPELFSEEIRAAFRSLH